MLFVVIGMTAGKSRDEVMSAYPRHKVFLDEFVARGEVVGVGPFLDPLYAWELERGRRSWRVPVRGGVVTNDHLAAAARATRWPRYAAVLRPRSMRITSRPGSSYDRIDAKESWRQP